MESTDNFVHTHSLYHNSVDLSNCDLKNIFAQIILMIVRHSSLCIKNIYCMLLSPAIHHTRCQSHDSAVDDQCDDTAA